MLRWPRSLCGPTTSRMQRCLASRAEPSLPPSRQSPRSSPTTRSCRAARGPRQTGPLPPPSRLALAPRSASSLTRPACPHASSTQRRRWPLPRPRRRRQRCPHPHRRWWHRRPHLQWLLRRPFRHHHPLRHPARRHLTRPCFGTTARSATATTTTWEALPPRTNVPSRRRRLGARASCFR